MHHTIVTDTMSQRCFTKVEFMQAQCHSIGSLSGFRSALITRLCSTLSMQFPVLLRPSKALPLTIPHHRLKAENPVSYSFKVEQALASSTHHLRITRLLLERKTTPPRHTYRHRQIQVKTEGYTVDQTRGIVRLLTRLCSSVTAR